MIKTCILLPERRIGLKKANHLQHPNTFRYHSLYTSWQIYTKGNTKVCIVYGYTFAVYESVLNNLAEMLPLVSSQ